MQKSKFFLYQDFLQFIILNKQRFNFIIMYDTCICNNSSINFYNIENVKERFIPTYYHTQIFPAEKLQPRKVRYTPTFKSNILSSDQKKAKKNFIKFNKAAFRPNSAENLIYKNVSRQKKQNQFYNSKGKINYKSEQLWYDMGKNELFNNMKLNKAYSKNRKLIDLSSGDVFDAGKIIIAQKQFTNEINQVDQIKIDKTINKNIQQYVQTEPLKDTNIDMHQTLNQNAGTINKQKSNKNKNRAQKDVQQVTYRSIVRQQNKQNPRKTDKNLQLNHVVQGYPKFTIIRKKPF